MLLRCALMGFGATTAGDQNWLLAATAAAAALL
jgi:hypothetical protein